MKRLANIFLVLVVLLATVQPKLVLHFCGNKFVTAYLNQAPTKPINRCAKYDIAERTDNCKNCATELTHSCPNRRFVQLSVDTDNFTFQTEQAPLQVVQVVLFFSKPQPWLAANDYTALLSGKSPPETLCVHSGRDILAKNCTLII